MPIAHKREIPTDFLNQMQENLKKKPETSSSVETPFVENKESINENRIYNEKILSNTVKTPEEKKDKYADVMNVRLSKGRRNEIKTFCTKCGITITQYIESSFEFFAREVEAGNIVISKGGITKVEK